MEGRFHVRSISLPCRLHSCTLRIDEELSKLKFSEAHKAADTVRAGLFGLEKLYECVDDLLRLPLTQQAVLQHQQEKWVGELLDGSVVLLDLCGTTRDLLSQMKERVRDLQSDLRRRRGKISRMESSIGAYISARKKAKKEILKGFELLKRLEAKLGSSPIMGLDQNQAVLARLLREICCVTISIFKLLLSFLSATASKPKSSGWSVVSKLMKQKVACEEEEEKVNEVERVDAALRELFKQSSKKDADAERVQIQMAQRRLEALEIGIEDLEGGLESMFRHLIQTRVSLLNIITS